MDHSINLIPHNLPPLQSDAIYTSCYCEENVYLLAKAFSESPLAGPNSQWGVFVVFISNHDKRVALWNQKASENVAVWDYHVILVLRTRRPLPTLAETISQTDNSPNQQSWVYDFDTRLAMPSYWTDYITGTFPYTSPDSEFQINDEFMSSFRVISAEEYLDNFASDRSHMIRVLEDGTSHYVSPPPTYDPLYGPKALAKGIKHNLMTSFVSMTLKPSEGCTVEEGRAGIRGAMGDETSDPELRMGAEIEGTGGYGEVMSMSKFLSWLS